MDKADYLNELAKTNNIEAIKLYIKHGGDINVCNKYGTPLMKAADNGHIEIVKLLLENKADPTRFDSNGYTAIMDAIENDNTEVIKLLHIHGYLEKEQK